MDSNLLKEAIADAKAVRQTALANAKVALEEAFNEKYQAMFAEKLREDAGMGQAPQAQAAPGMGATEETVSEQEIDELIKELESEVAGKAPGEEEEEGHAEPDADNIPGAPAPMGGAPAPAVPPMGGEMGAPAPAAPAAPGQQMVLCPVGQVATAAMPPAPVDGAMPGAMPAAPAMPPMGAAPTPAPMGEPPVGGAPEGGAPSPEGNEPPTPPSDIPNKDETDEEVSLEELLQSLREEVEKEEEGCKEEEEESIKEIKGEEEEEEEECKLDEQTKLDSSNIGSGKAGGSPNKKPSTAASSTSKIENAANDDEGYAKLDQPKVVTKEATQANRPNKASHATKDNLSTPSMGKSNGSGGQSDIGYPKSDQAKVTAKEASTASRPNQAKNATATNLSTPGGALQENKSLKSQLNEAEQVIRFVKGQLNEVNLLNAKLLYTNKLFKEYNMNNTHKMSIVEMFDLAKNIREVKLTYANIAESLNFSGNEIKKKVVATTNASVQSITEGLASKPVGSTKPGKQILSENLAMVTKFQKLAGITKH